MALAAVRDLRQARPSASAEELAEFETDVLSGFVLARAAAGLADGAIREGHDPDQRDVLIGRNRWRELS